MHRHTFVADGPSGTEEDGTPLVTRTRIVQTPWFGIYFHKHLNPDTDRELHNHPWTFVSLVLRGGYTEEWAANMADAVWAKRGADTYTGKFTPALGQPRTWRPGSIHVMRLSNYHRIRRHLGEPTWTLLLVGKRRQKWGYATVDGFREAQTEQYV